MRYFFTIAYRGTDYHGWQKQPNATSVQEQVEQSFSTILNQPVEIVGSGRTDSGVHASGQVFHVDFEKEVDAAEMLYRANKMLPKDVALSNVRAVREDVHARFAAQSRSYQYKIATRKNPFAIDQYYLFTKKLDVAKMNEAARVLLQHTDFESFCKVKTDVFTFNCEIYKADWKQEGELLVFSISANRFLRGMVRAIVGTLLEVGQDRLTVTSFEEIVIAKDRNKAGSAAPAKGLFLTEVKYPEAIYL